jgi:hypothetical protein
MLWEIIDPSYLKTRIDNLDLSLSGLRDALRGTGNKTLTDLDTDLSNIYGRLDVALSTRASDSTLSTLSGKFPSAVALGDSLGNPTTTITGAANLGFDGTYWRRIAADTSGRMKVALDSIPNPSNLDITLSALRDALRGTGNKTLTDLDTDLSNIYGRLDVALSTRASDSTLSGLSGKFPSAVALADNLSNPTTTIIGDALLGFDGTYWRRVRVDTSGRLAIQNEPNLDVALSTRASETTLSNIYNRLDVTLSTRLADSKIPNALAQISRDIAGSTVYGLAVIASLAHDITRMPYMVDDINVTTTESSTSISAPGAKVVKITNKGDVDCLVGINASVPTNNPLKVKARTAKIFLFGGATAIYYKTASGSTTISIEYFN